MNTKPIIKFDELDMEIISSPAELEVLKGGGKNTSTGHLEILQHFNFICWVNDICPKPN